MPSEQFERNLRAKLEQAQVPPRPELWDAIAQQLADQPAKRPPIFWLWLDGLLGMAILLLWLIGPPAGMPSNPASNENAPAIIAHHQEEVTSTKNAPQSLLSSSQMMESEKQTSFDSHGIDQGSDTGVQAEMNSRTSNMRTSLSPSQGEKDLGAKVIVPTSDQDEGTHLLASLQETQMNSGRSTRLIEGASDALLVKSVQSRLLQEDNIVASVFQPKATEIAYSSEMDDAPLANPWIFSVSVRGQQSPGKAGVLPFVQSNEPDIRTNYSRGLGGNQQILEDIYGLRFPRSGFSTHLGIAYQVNKRLGLESGIGISHFRQGKYEVGSLRGEPPIGPTIPEPYIEYSEPYFFQQSQLEIPLQLNISLPQGRNSWILATGVSMNYQLTWKVRQAANDRLLNEGRNILSPGGSLVLGQRTWYPHLHSKLLYQASISKQTFLFVGPSFQYQLIGSYAGGQSIGQARYRIGLELGLGLRK